jgi:acyl phosphate:glycerol-3-phosphate acyltransferase
VAQQCQHWQGFTHRLTKLDILMTPIMTLAITDWLWFGLIALAAYLLGSVCTAIFVCRLFGLADPRSTGSSNPGATNVMRLGGKLPALLTFLGDALKGVPPILLAYGHIYPVFFGFAGGKGVATAFGVLLGLDWRLCVGALLSWAIVFALTRVSSLASLITFVVLVPIFAYFWQIDLLPALSLMGLLILWRHRQNIADLMQGKERGFRQSKS